MLILFMMFLIIAVALILVIRRNQESLYLLLLCLSLAVYLFGIMLYIAKKGGINRDLQNFLFLSNEIKLMFQYFLITLDSLGLIILVGRIMFPTVLLLISIHFSMIAWIRKNPYLKKLILVIPILTFIAYYPKVFREMADASAGFQEVIIMFSYYWILLYILLSVALLLYEYREFKFMFWKRYFLHITLFIFSLIVMFSLYVRQDPSQVYFFYGDNYVWTRGIYYMSSAMSVSSYIIVILINLIAAGVGLVSFLKYTRGSIIHDREDVIMKRKFDTANIGASAFVHSTKNHLLSNRILLKRMGKDLESKDINVDEVKTNIKKMSDINETLLKRVDELYKAVKAKSIEMTPTKSDELFERSMMQFREKYPEIHVDIEEDPIVLMVDTLHMSEVINNVISNAADAIILKFQDPKEGLIKIRAYNERLYSVIEISDNGMGIRSEDKKRIFEPFYSNKNSNYNWGMGLHYAREIVKGHYGTIRLESVEGVGTQFYILIPRY